MKEIRCAVVMSIALVGVVLLMGVPVSMGQAQSQPALHHTLDMTVVKPETVGFSSERLEKLHALMQQTVDKKELAGIVTILARHGKVVDYRAYGQRDMASGAVMTKATIFREY